MSFDRGQYSMGGLASRHVAQRDLKSHTRLKLRRTRGEGEESVEDRLKRLKDDLQAREQQLGNTKVSLSASADDLTKPSSTSTNAVDQFDDADDVRSRASSSSSSDDEETKDIKKITTKIGSVDPALQKELERVRKEKLAKEALGLVPITGVNPLLEKSGVQRRWDDDVIFKHQSKSEPENKPTERRLVNDIVHSDRHKDFMKTFIK